MLELSSLREHLRGKLVCSITLTLFLTFQGFHFDLPPFDEVKGKNKIVSLQLLAVTLSTI